MAELKVPISVRFSEKEQKDLYETCMAYKELAETRGAENDKLKELVEDMLGCIEIRAAFGRPPTSEMCEEFTQRAGELGIEEDE